MKYILLIIFIWSINIHAQTLDSVITLDVNAKLQGSLNGKISKEGLKESKGLIIEPQFYYEYEIIGYRLTAFFPEAIEYIVDSTGELPKPFLKSIDYVKKSDQGTRKQKIFFEYIKCKNKFGKHFNLQAIQIELE